MTRGNRGYASPSLEERLIEIIDKVTTAILMEGKTGFTRDDATKDFTSLFYELANEIIENKQDIDLKKGATMTWASDTYWEGQKALRTQQRQHLKSILGGK